MDIAGYEMLTGFRICWIKELIDKGNIRF